MSWLLTTVGIFFLIGALVFNSESNQPGKTWEQVRNLSWAFIACLAVGVVVCILGIVSFWYPFF
ncbi:MAG: hypothetical protein COT91_02275 [Candidatus Doudnabacteria bacterium CG10_big_fil_rev_8_21_14_0_10_41_10]|uniref:Uncharacterized protein n=1 Tax=Candidatus Doudnabacteria bacterium CG10_big_fil_rev_8_21_14_0_10_41_10 TaxID=1974551 RepID=A0A2H0VG51_9BACT|nr:MAG: hypothetical protein COT91_02275 [Candidatus Doudnabacteria bacterium CG10_big_fil_rev_8_21_14_0_10_41_10]